MPDRNSSTGGKSKRRTKVEQLIDKYELDDIGAEMERLWTADSGDRKSLRELSAFFNQELLKMSMIANGLETLDGEVENIYRLLSDNEVREADRMRTRRRLEREGLDIDELTSDFVTYQAIRSYLKDTRGAEYTPNDRDPLEREAENFQKIRGQTASITEGKLEQLRSSDQLDVGTFRTFVEISVVCEDCGTRYEVAELLDRGRCECDHDREYQCQ